MIIMRRDISFRVETNKRPDGATYIVQVTFHQNFMGVRVDRRHRRTITSRSHYILAEQHGGRKSRVQVGIGTLLIKTETQRHCVWKGERERPFKAGKERGCFSYETGGNFLVQGAVI
jgi:hypothetical protein